MSNLSAEWNESSTWSLSFGEDVTKVTSACECAVLNVDRGGERGRVRRRVIA